MNELMNVANTSHWLPPALMDAHGNPFQFDMNYTSAVFAAVVTIYYWWQNIKGIEESSGKAMQVMQITTIMVVDSADLGRLFRLHSRRSSAPGAYCPSTSSSATMRWDS